jgi:hypothetical protein
MKFRKKPVVIEAVRFEQPTGVGDAPEWLVEAVMRNDFLVVDGVAHITTLEGIMTAKPGDWIIRGVKGEIYSCKPDIFAATYECATPPSPSTAPTKRNDVLEEVARACEELQDADEEGPDGQRRCFESTRDNCVDVIRALKSKDMPSTAPTVDERADDPGANIKTWKERLFEQQPELRAQYHEDSGALDEIGCWIKDEEIADLRVALASRPAALTARDLLDAMTDGERLELFGHYCKACGCKDPSCQCWNDE